MPTYYEIHRDHCLELARRYRATHIEEIRQRQREYYQKVLKYKRAFGKKLYNIEFPKPPKPEPRIKTTKRFLAATPVPKNPRAQKPKKVFPDLSTIKDFSVTPPSGLVEKKPGIFIDWNNL